MDIDGKVITDDLAAGPGQFPGRLFDAIDDVPAGHWVAHRENYRIHYFEFSEKLPTGTYYLKFEFDNSCGSVYYPFWQIPEQFIDGIQIGASGGASMQYVIKRKPIVKARVTNQLGTPLNKTLVLALTDENNNSIFDYTKKPSQGGYSHYENGQLNVVLQAGSGKEGLLGQRGLFFEKFCNDTDPHSYTFHVTVADSEGKADPSYSQVSKQITLEPNKVIDLGTIVLEKK